MEKIKVDDDDDEEEEKIILDDWGWRHNELTCLIHLVAGHIKLFNVFYDVEWHIRNEQT